MSTASYPSGKELHHTVYNDMSFAAAYSNYQPALGERLDISSACSQFAHVSDQQLDINLKCHLANSVKQLISAPFNLAAVRRLQLVRQAPQQHKLLTELTHILLCFMLCPSLQWHCSLAVSNAATALSARHPLPSLLPCCQSAIEGRHFVSISRH